MSSAENKTPSSLPRANWLGLLLLAAATVLAHWLAGDRYGFHRDELSTLDDARHLAWGFVSYPPVTPFFGWLSLHLFGTSLAGFRFFASLAGAIALVLTGLIARELGGSRWTQLFAACCATPLVLAIGALMQYVSFDYLAWVAVAYFIARLCRTNDPRWWLAAGAAIGFGILSKYSMPFLIAGVGLGFLTSSNLRPHLRSKWLWFGAAIAILMVLPNLLWQWQHEFISLKFLQSIHARDVRIGRTKDFLPDQLTLTFCALPVALSGLWFYLTQPAARRFRVLGWMFAVPFVIFIIAQGRGYYMAAGYPMLYAGGAVQLSIWLRRMPTPLRLTTSALGWTALVGNIILFGALFLPFAPVNSPWWQRMVAINDDLREEIGWPELVQEVARIRDSLPPDNRARVRILAGNYGEAGAINLYGPPLGLPSVICATNSFWERGYGDPPPELLIVLGSDRAELEQKFESVELVGHITNHAGVANEETRDHPDIFLCRHLRGGWRELWPKAQRFG